MVNNYQSNFIQTASLLQVTAFIFWEEGCDWSQSINKQFIDGVIGRYDICIRHQCKYHTRADSQLFQVKTEYTFFI